MQYMLTLYSEEGGWNRLTETQQQQAVASYMAYTEALKNAGALVASNRLQPSSSATTVRIKEQIGGYFLIDVLDLDAALTWAARCPGAAHGIVEVRPIWCMGASSQALKNQLAKGEQLTTA
jgi:hypothetical protein